MQIYLDLLRKTVDEGVDRVNEGTGQETRSLFGAQLRVDLQQGFPLVTTRAIDFKKVAAELLWCIKGDTNIEYLHRYGVSKWDNWADEHGYVGPLYGEQWRRWECADCRKVDQLHNLITQIKFNSTSRRLILSSWNVGCVDQMWVTPSNVMVQFYVQNGKLSSLLMQRTSDIYNRLPETIASYGLLNYLVAKECNLEVGDFVWVGGEVHVYHGDMEQIKQLTELDPQPLPRLNIMRDVDFLSQYEVEDFKLEDYVPAENAVELDQTVPIEDESADLVTNLVSNAV